MKNPFKQSLQINTRKLTNGITGIVIKGFLDAYTYDKLEQTINNLFNRKQYKLVVDMSGVDGIGSAGVRIFLWALDVARENNGNIIIVHPKPAVRDVFDLIGVSHILTMTLDMASALKTFTI